MICLYVYVCSSILNTMVNHVFWIGFETFPVNLMLWSVSLQTRACIGRCLRWAFDAPDGIKRSGLKCGSNEHWATRIEGIQYIEHCIVLCSLACLKLYIFHHWSSLSLDNVCQRLSIASNKFLEVFGWWFNTGGSRWVFCFCIKQMHR